MRRISTILLLGFGLAASVFGSRAAEADAHDYFNALVARPDHWKSYSLRSSAQLTYPRNGGYASANSGTLSVTFDPSTDPNPERQDAAKAVIPAFSPQTNILVVPVGPTDTRFQLADSTGNVTRVTTAVNSPGRQIRIGSEIVVATSWPAPCPSTNASCNPLDRTTGILNVTRGQYGTTASSHVAGVRFAIANNSLPIQIRVPLGTSDGNRYFFVWDSYHTASYLGSGLTNHKAFQFESSGIWLEPQTRFDGGGGGGAQCFDPAVHVAGAEARAYSNPGGPATWQPTGNFMGPGTTGNQPVQPKVGGFCIHPSRWTRWFVLIDQRSNDYDLMSMWMADEVQDPVQIYDRIPLNVQADTNPPHSIVKWWIELNTSQDELEGSRAFDHRDLVSYHRNFVSLINPPSNIAPFLIRPDPNATLGPLPPGESTKRPKPPTNLRAVD